MLAAWAAATLLAAAPADARRWEDEVVYVVIVQKFADGDPANNHMRDRFHSDRGRYEGGFWGGDLKGVRDRLDDLADLGVTAVLLYPVVHNDENPVGKYLPTGYRPKDYDRVDPNFGDEADVRSLVEAAHARGIRVLLDMPIALPGFEHPFLADPAKKDWLGPPSAYGVPRWKAENPAVADYLTGVCRRWKERSGCDGFRVDSAHLLPAAFWKRFVSELKAAPPAGEFLIVAELPLNPREIGPFMTEAGFDGAYDFSAMTSRDVFGRGEDVGRLSFVAGEAAEFYPSPRAMLAPIDNYEDAFVAVAKEPKAARTRLALTYLLTLDRVPLLYPGNELGVEVREAGEAFPEGRRELPFYKDVKALIALRKSQPALRRGGFSEVLARDSVYAFLRGSGDDRVLVVLNGSDGPREFSADPGGRAWRDCRLTDLLGGGTAKPAGDDTAVRLEAFGSRVLKVE